MSEYALLIKRAESKLKIADHMINMSYKLVDDPKILLSGAITLFESLESAMSAVLDVERIFKRVSPYNNTFESKYATFNTKLVKKNPRFKEGLEILKKLHSINVAHKKSPVEFSRKDKFVICLDDYEMVTVELKDLKNYINKAKVFIEQCTIIINASVGILR